jgi:hypothetical protein
MYIECSSTAKAGKNSMEHGICTHLFYYILEIPLPSLVTRVGLLIVDEKRGLEQTLYISQELSSTSTSSFPLFSSNSSGYTVFVVKQS